MNKEYLKYWMTSNESIFQRAYEFFKSSLSSSVRMRGFAGLVASVLQCRRSRRPTWALTYTTILQGEFSLSVFTLLWIMILEPYFWMKGKVNSTIKPLLRNNWKNYRTKLDKLDLFSSSRFWIKTLHKWMVKWKNTTSTRQENSKQLKSIENYPYR